METEDERKKERRGQEVKSAEREVWRVEITSSSSDDRKLPHLLIFTFLPRHLLAQLTAQ